MRIAFSISAMPGAREGEGEAAASDAHADAVHQFRDRLADRRPIRLGVVAGPCQRLAQRAQPGFIPQRRETGPPQQRPQRGVAERSR